MAILGLLLTIDPTHEASLRRRLQARDDLELGETLRGRIPAVLSTGDSREAERAMREVWDEEGVHFVDLVSADFSDAHDPTPTIGPRS